MKRSAMKAERFRAEAGRAHKEITDHAPADLEPRTLRWVAEWLTALGRLDESFLMLFGAEASKTRQAPAWQTNYSRLAMQCKFTLATTLLERALKIETRRAP